MTAESQMKDITNSAKDRKNWADFIREDYDKAAFLTAAKMGERSVSVNRRW